VVPEYSCIMVRAFQAGKKRPGGARLLLRMYGDYFTSFQYSFFSA
jgi:hypothetical protein